MAETEKQPRYMEKLLQELGWNQGTRIPLADEENQNLETLLIAKQNEIQQLKEACSVQKQKSEDLKKYKDYTTTENQENTRLLFALKQQLEQEIKLHQLSINEISRLDRDWVTHTKESKEIAARIEKIQLNISKMLKKADTMKGEVCGERGALQEWRAALERSSCDIMAIEQFTKQDISKAKALETQRQKLKEEHDRLQARLNHIASNLCAEERACQRISEQVMEAMEQRKSMMDMWTAAVDNLRQRDKDIRHIREDYALLEIEASKLTEECREQQQFCDQQIGNNQDMFHENTVLSQQLSNTRLEYGRLVDSNMTLDSEAQSLQRELSNMKGILEKLRMENRRIMDEQHRKDTALEVLSGKLKELKEKLKDSNDKSKSAEKRAKELEDMLNEEERYANLLTVNQQRAMHCSFLEQQKLIALKNEEKLFHMQLKASKAIMNKLHTKQIDIERKLQTQKESLYNISFQVEMLGAKIMQLEGNLAEREINAELVAKEARLKEVLARHTARVSLLERHAAKLTDDMRLLNKDLESKTVQHEAQMSRLRYSMLNMEGGEKELKTNKENYRRERVEETLLRMRVAHAMRAVAGLEEGSYTLETQRLQLDAAMNERLVEINVRRDMFTIQKRSLLDDVGKLQSSIRERMQKIEQLKKRHDIFISTMGKVDGDGSLNVAFFKIKFAAERAELRERGAALDVEVTRSERDVSALEATLRVVAAAHAHFTSNIAPLTPDAPQLKEVRIQTDRFYELRDQLKAIQAEIAEFDQNISMLSESLNALQEKNKILDSKVKVSSDKLEVAMDQEGRNRSRLDNAREVVKANLKRAKKLIESREDWKNFQIALWLRDYTEAAYNTLNAILDACNYPEARARFAALVATTDLSRFVSKYQRRILGLLQRILADPNSVQKEIERATIDERGRDSVFSKSDDSVKSGASIASGYTRRLMDFRKELAPKVQESTLIDEIPDVARKSTISLRVVTVGLERYQRKPTGKLSKRRSHH